MKNVKKVIVGSIMVCLASSLSMATKIVSVTPLDNQYIMITFLDGEVVRRDDGTENCAFMGHCHSADGSKTLYYGTPLNVSQAMQASNWVIKSSNDRVYRRRGKAPVAVHRKSKLHGMSISRFDELARDYVYDHAMAHTLYLKLPSPLQHGKTYTIVSKGNLNSDKAKITFTYDIYHSVSEAIHINLAGYTNKTSLKAADLYQWLGDGGSRDYSLYEGKKVFLVNVFGGQKYEAGKVAFWKEQMVEFENHNFTRANVWNIDFTGTYPEGTYRLVVEDVGCSPEFNISTEVYYEPYKVSTQGFFYMRLGQDSPEINPRPRKPLFIPGVDGTIVPISTLHPYHPAWEDIRRRKTDPWDHPREFEPFATHRQNNNGWGGHSDAYDWDKRLQHVSIVYDMLLPYILTRGSLTDDNFGIAESENGIPDLLDEARYEVDAWLRLRDGKGYAHGITCPYNEENRIRFQSANTAVAAWANALNSAMLAEAFRIGGYNSLMQIYLDSALVAFHYAENLEDKMLDHTDIDGIAKVRGRDFMMMAAAYLYNLTGNTRYEDIMAAECVLNAPGKTIINVDKHNQLWGIAAYLITDRPVNYPELRLTMKNAITTEAKEMEAGLAQNRPSRRATCKDSGYFWTLQNVQRTIIAHAVADNQQEQEFFLNALFLEADWSLGRNPANIIQMTTASTPLASKRSVEFSYTSGYNDGSPGLHPGHTPYWNMNDWAPAMIMGRPSWLASHGYPQQNQWPAGELFFNTDYVWAHTEFTPQQTMRGKMALYAYLYALTK